LVEQLICNQQVVGSNPSAGSLFEIAETERKERSQICSRQDGNAGICCQVNPPEGGERIETGELNPARSVG
jgi:hypothetical protein